MTSEQAWLKFGDLELDGFVVDCAQTAEAGLALARSQTYDLILLDHRLPDRFGTDLLPDLTPRERPVPLIVLTGFGEVDGAVSAIRDGPAAYKQKPIEGAVLVALIRDVLEKFRTRHDHASGADADPKAIELERLETVYGRLGTCISKRELTGIILRTLFDRRLTLRSFPGCAAALRHVVTTADTSVLLIGLEVRRLISTAAATPLPGHPKLIAAVAGLEAGGIKQSQAIFAQHRTLSRAYLSHLVTTETGRHASEWCRAAVMRSAVRHVIQTSDQFSQIAYNLGYGHAGQFSHDFGEYFGLSPRQLRCVSSGLRYLR